jgi:holo-[acyl-carrier protein] synthase
LNKQKETDAQGLDALQLDEKGLDAQGQSPQGLDAQGQGAQRMDGQGQGPQGLDALQLDEKGLDTQRLDARQLGGTAVGTDGPISNGSRDILAQGQVGLGVDLVDIARMKRILARTPSFATKVFSQAEQDYCFSKATPEIHFATRFAAKEAVLKALGTGFDEGIMPRDVEVGRTAKGRPYAILHGRAKEAASEAGVLDLPLSLSYTHLEAVACAMAITTESVRAVQERIDPMEELAKQFKEVRSLLDDMGTGQAKEDKPAAEPLPGSGEGAKSPNTGRGPVKAAGQSPGTAFEGTQ